MFYASYLSPYKETEEHGPNFSNPPSDVIDREEEWEVERVIDKRLFGQNKKVQYKVRWKGYVPAHDSWEPEENIHAPDIIQAFETQQMPTRGL